MRLPGASWFLAAALSACPLAAATTITLPAAASIQGIAPFFSDVRVFNTSYTDTLAVGATYRCFLGACPASAPEIVFPLAPRESAAFDDMVRGTFAAPDTAGGVEFLFEGTAEQLVVTSRLYSTFPTPTVGMFIPGMDASQAYTTSVLTSVRNGGSGQGFRTNVGLFNPGDAPVTAQFRVFTGFAQQGVAVVRPVPPHSGVQVNAIFTAAGVADLETSNGVVVVDASAPVFAYAAVIDNATTDPYYVAGDADRLDHADGDRHGDSDRHGYAADVDADRLRHGHRDAVTVAEPHSRRHHTHLLAVSHRIADGDADADAQSEPRCSRRRHQ